MTLRQALAQPEHEPVAWRNTETGEFCTGGFLRKDLARWIPLYTAPPKREWVGLEEESLNMVTDEFYAGAVWAEAKLKEKNGG